MTPLLPCEPLYFKNQLHVTVDSSSEPSTASYNLQVSTPLEAIAVEGYIQQKVNNIIIHRFTREIQNLWGTLAFLTRECARRSIHKIFSFKVQLIGTSTRP